LIRALAIILCIAGCGSVDDRSICGDKMSQQQLLITGGSDPLIAVDSADFDGTNDYMTRGADLTGNADSKSGIISAWVRLDGGNGTDLLILSDAISIGSATPRFTFFRGVANKFYIFGEKLGSVIILQLESTATYQSGSAWIHVLASWNLAVAGSRSLFINDVSDLTEVIFTDDTLKYTAADWIVGAIGDGSVKMNGCLAELYFAPGQYLDFSVESNRRKFISASLKPLDLGSDGSLPTGTAPLIYHHLDNGEAVANFALNRGTGGNFSVTGTLATGSTSPSD
jgi:hypothetical protein